MKPTIEKILLIRFSSLGDVTQTLSVASKLSALGELHWVLREDMAPLTEGHPAIFRLWKLNRRSGFLDLLRLALRLRAERFSRVYDAHNSLRSRLISLVLRFRFFPPKLARKPRHSWKRFLLFKFHKNTFTQPFSGQRELLRPLKKWGISEELPPTPQIFFSPQEKQAAEKKWPHFPKADTLGLAPSSAHQLKRWPINHWKELVGLLPNNKFILFGGPEDDFLSEIQEAAPDRVVNLAGQLSLKGSGATLTQCRLLVSNDTGLLHIAEQSGVPAIALMGPAPFGFPSREQTLILERNLPCRPCSKHGQGPCTNPNFQECLRSISPQEVAQNVLRILSNSTGAL